MKTRYPTLAMPFEFKQTGAKGSGGFEGYASTRKLDSVGDIVMPGAFARTIDHAFGGSKDAAGAGGGLPVLWFHSPLVPIGLLSAAGEDVKGLHVVGEIDTDTQAGHDTYSGMCKGYIDRMSIGYKAVRHEYDRKQRARLLHEIALKETSMITKGWAANDEALVTALKAFPAYVERCVSEYSDGGSTSSRLSVSVLDAETIEEVVTALQTLLGSGILGAIDIADALADAAGDAIEPDDEGFDTDKSSSGSARATRSAHNESGSALATLIRATTLDLKGTGTAARHEDEVKAADAIRDLVNTLKSDVRKDV